MLSDLNRVCARTTYCAHSDCYSLNSCLNYCVRHVQVNRKIEVTTNTMHENISLMLENDGKLEEIEGKANNMTEQVLWRCVHYLSLSVHTHDARIDRIQRTVVFRIT